MYFCYMQIATFFWLANEYSILAIKLKSKSDELNDSDHEKKFQFRKKLITIVSPKKEPPPPKKKSK